MKQENRQRKGDIKYGFSLNEEQKHVKESVYKYDVTFVLGNFGLGKTAVAAQISLDLLYKGHVDNIIISRPVDFEATGYLKGTADEKLAFHVFPIKQNLYACSGKEKIETLFKSGKIQIIPIDYMKGMTFSDSVVIIDEFEDITYPEFKLILSRLGKDSKLIFTGSEEQIGIDKSCIHRIKCLKNSLLVGYHELTSQHRNDLILPIVEYIEKHG